MKAVIDTNVLIAANGRDCPQVTPQCQFSAIKYLETFQKEGMVIVDDKWLILKEYQNKVNPKGQPGIGDAFLKWILTNQANPKRCQKITITPKDGSFQEFPDDASLTKFDPSDRKFVAVALKSPDRPPIINAVDPDWAECYEALTQLGLTIEFLCPDIVLPIPNP